MTDDSLAPLPECAEQLRPTPFDRLLCGHLVSRFADAHQHALPALLWVLAQDYKEGCLSSRVDQLGEQLRARTHSLPLAADLGRALQRHLPVLLRDNPRLFLDQSTTPDEGNAPFIIHQNRIYPRRHWQQRQLFRTLLSERLRPVAPEENTLWGLTDLAHQASRPSLLSGAAGDGDGTVEQLVRVLSQHRLVLLIGGPGSGKTTTLVSLLRRLFEQAGPYASQLRVALAGPTGRAAGRMIESVAHARAQHPHEIDNLLPQQGMTLHRLLGINRHGIASHRQDCPVAYDLLVVDEASMVDLRLFNQTLQALPLHSRLILIGDPDQLPPVEPGPALQILLSMPRLSNAVVRLEGSRRSVPPIQQLAKAVKNADLDHVHALFQRQDSQPSEEQAVVCRPLPSFFGYCRYLERQYRQDQQGILPPPQPDELDPHPSGWLERVQCCLPLLESMTALSPTRKGSWGVPSLNRQLDRAFGGNTTNYHGRRIVITRNDHRNQLANGDRAIVLSFASRLYAFFPSLGEGWRSFPLEQLQAYESAWVQTIHRSQGSEFDHVELLLPEGDGVNVELLYTAITRARKRLRLYSQLENLVLLLSA